jgi:hypothetical protein
MDEGARMMVPQATGRAMVMRRCLFVFCLALAAAAEGRVFWRWQRAWPGERVAATLGWDAAYRTSMRLDGAEADVAVWASDRALRSTIEALREACRREGARCEFVAGERIGWGMAAWERRWVRILVFEIDSSPRPLVLWVEQARRAVDEHRQPGRLHPPGAIRGHTYEDRQSGAHFETVISPLPVVDSAQHYDRQLAEEGWTALWQMPLDTAGVARWYQRGGALCGVRIRPSDAGGGSTVAVLRKEIGVRGAGAGLE